MFDQIIDAKVGNVFVVASNGAHTPEEWAKIATSKIIHVGDQSHYVIQEQARAFEEKIKNVIAHYINLAVEQDRLYRK